MTCKLRHPVVLRHPVPKYASCFLINVCVCSLPFAIYTHIYMYTHVWEEVVKEHHLGLPCRRAPLESRYKPMCVNICIYAYVCACMCMCMCMCISGSRHGTSCGPSLVKGACCAPIVEWFQLIALTYIYIHEVRTRICNMYVHKCVLSVCVCVCVCVCMCVLVYVCVYLNFPHAINTGKQINYTCIRLFLRGNVWVCAQVRAWVS